MGIQTPTASLEREADLLNPHPGNHRLIRDVTAVHRDASSEAKPSPWTARPRLSWREGDREEGGGGREEVGGEVELRHGVGPSSPSVDPQM